MPGRSAAHCRRRLHESTGIASKRPDVQAPRRRHWRRRRTRAHSGSIRPRHAWSKAACSPMRRRRGCQSTVNPSVAVACAASASIGADNVASCQLCVATPVPAPFRGRCRIVPDVGADRGGTCRACQPTCQPTRQPWPWPVGLARTLPWRVRWSWHGLCVRPHRGARCVSPINPQSQGSPSCRPSL